MDCFVQTIGYAKNLMHYRRKNYPIEKNSHQLTHILIWLVLDIGNLKNKTKCLRLIEKPKHVSRQRKMNRKILTRGRVILEAFFFTFMPTVLVFSSWLLEPTLNEEHHICSLLDIPGLFVFHIILNMRMLL